MKIITNGETVAVTGIPSIGGNVRIPLEAAPAALGDTVQLQRDDGFVLASYTVADYLRHYMDGTTLVLTNTPEPVPVVPDAATIKAERQTAIKAACEAAIVAGFDADVLGRGTLHYTLTTIQQRDLEAMMQAVKDGTASVLWHDVSRVTHEAYTAAQFTALYQIGYAWMIHCKIRSDWLEQYAIDLIAAGNLTTAQTVGWDTVLPDIYQAQADAQISAMLGGTNA